MKVSRQLVTALGVIGTGTVVGLIAAPGHRALVVSSAVMAALGCVLLEVGRAAHALSSEGSQWARVRAEPNLVETRPADLEHLERVLGWGQYSSGDFNYKVRPLLRRLTGQRLLERSIDIDARPEAARSVVSIELWDLVVAKQAVETPGVIRTDDIVRMVDEIEAL
jgi:hypothetical protein